MVSLKSVLSVFAFAVALAGGAVQGSPLEDNPVAQTTNISKLTHFNPVFGAYVPDNVVVYAVPVKNIPLPKSNADPLAKVEAPDAGHRSLEGTSSTTDMDKLEGYFKTPMERDFTTLSTPQYLKASFDPIPWPSSYWPTYADGINYRWSDSEEPSPAEKYALAYGLDVKSFTDSVSRSTGILSQSYRKQCSKNEDCADQNDGSICGIRQGQASGYCIPGWFGICHAWAPAAILEKEPTCAVKKGSTTFKVMDIKALLTQVYDGAYIDIVFTGARFNGPDWPEDKDEYGRYINPARRDIGAGFFHIAITNILGRFKKSFVVDVATGAEVWNQPIRGYEVLEAKEYSRAEAAQIFFDTNEYPFNNDATKLMFARTKLSWMNEAAEDGPLIEEGHADWYTYSREYTYLLELDSQGQIIGGEWVQDSRSDHPDFLWFPEDRPSLDTVTSIGLSYKDVSDLLDASLKCVNLDQSPAPSPSPSPAPTSAAPSPSPIPAPAPSSCASSGTQCGSDAQGVQCCASPGDYCQPWNPWFYQCRPAPPQCGEQQVGVDFYGDDLGAPVYAILPEQCCAKCAETPGCKTYTFVNFNSDGRSACYLKRDTGDKRSVVGAVSAKVKNPLPATSQPPPSTTCSIPEGGNCGNVSSSQCCPSGSYCQPWNVWYYQCIKKPAQCSQQFTDVDFYGNDLSVAYNFSPADCCAKCAQTSGCKAYTFVNDNPGATACYLKSSTSGKRGTTGAVSGILN